MDDHNEGNRYTEIDAHNDNTVQNDKINELLAFNESAKMNRINDMIDIKKSYASHRHVERNWFRRLSIRIEALEMLIFGEKNKGASKIGGWSKQSFIPEDPEIQQNRAVDIFEREKKIFGVPAGEEIRYYRQNSAFVYFSNMLDIRLIINL